MLAMQCPEVRTVAEKSLIPGAEGAQISVGIETTGA